MWGVTSWGAKIRNERPDVSGWYVGPSVGTSGQVFRNRRARGGLASYNFGQRLLRQDTPGNNTTCGVAAGRLGMR